MELRDVWRKDLNVFQQLSSGVSQDASHTHLQNTLRQVFRQVERGRTRLNKLKQLAQLLDLELVALKALDRAKLDELNATKIQLLQTHYKLRQMRPWYLAPFSPQEGASVSLSYICTHLPAPFNGWVQAFQEALKTLALEIKERQARNAVRATTARR